VDRDSIIGIATHYELKRPGIEYRWRRIFRTRPDRPKSQPSLLKNGYRVSLFGVKGPRRGAKHTRPSSAEVKERVELDLYPPLGLQACSRPNFNLYGTAVAYWWGKAFKIWRLSCHNRQLTAKSFPEPLSTPQTSSTIHNNETEWDSYIPDKKQRTLIPSPNLGTLTFLNINIHVIYRALFIRNALTPPNTVTLLTHHSHNHIREQSQTVITMAQFQYIT